MNRNRLIRIIITAFIICSGIMTFLNLKNIEMAMLCFFACVGWYSALIFFESSLEEKATVIKILG